MTICKIFRSFSGLFLMLCLYHTMPLCAQGSFSVEIQVVHPISCHGYADGQLSAVVPGGGSAFQYQWSNGATTPTIQDIAAGAYVVVVQNAAGGTGTATFVFGEPAPLQTSLAVGGQVTCNTPNVNVQAQTTGGSWPYQFNWSSGQVDSIISVNQGGSYGVVVTDVNGCQYQANAAVSENTTFPLVNGVDSSSLLCAGTPIQIQKTCTNMSTVGYQWFAPNGLPIPGALSANLGVDSAGLYKVSVQNFVNGCLALDSVMVVNNVLNATPQNANGGVYLDSISIFTAGGVGPYTFSWMNSFGTVVSVDSTLSNVPSGQYSRLTQDNNGCSVQSGPFQLASSSAAIEASAIGLQVYPNPFRDVVTISTKDVAAERVDVFTLSGQWLMGQNVQGASITLDLQNLPSAIYILKIRHLKGVSTVEIAHN